MLSRPYILACDNQLASITVGQEVPFINNSRITDTGQTINTLNYNDVGILLDVIPHINPDGLVILDVAPEISAADRPDRADFRQRLAAHHRQALGPDARRHARTARPSSSAA